MSSRLFLEIRERLGLAYSIHSYADHYLDTGALTIYAGIQPEQLSRCLEAILAQLKKMKEELVPDHELRKAKEYCKGRLLLRMEDSQSVAGWLGGQEILTGSIRSVEEVASILESVSASQIRQVAEELFLTDKINLAVVGPVDESDLEQVLSF